MRTLLSTQINDNITLARAKSLTERISEKYEDCTFFKKNLNDVLIPDSHGDFFPLEVEYVTGVRIREMAVKPTLLEVAHQFETYQNLLLYCSKGETDFNPLLFDPYHYSMVSEAYRFMGIENCKDMRMFEGMVTETATFSFKVRGLWIPITELTSVI